MSPSLRIGIFVFAILGLLVSMTLNVVGWYRIDPGLNMTETMAIQLGSIIVVLPLILHYKQTGEPRSLMKEKGLDIIAFFKAFFTGIPIIVIVFFVFGFLYTGINFFLTDDSYRFGIPEIHEGRFVQNSHGSLSSITEWEFHYYRSQHIRKISGHWMFFYSFAIIGAYPRRSG